MNTKAGNEEKVAAKNRIQELIQQSKTVKNDSLKSALEKHIEEEKKKEEEQLLEQFKAGSKLLSAAIRELKEMRRHEKAAKARVIAIDNAFEQFKINGDFNAFKIKMYKQNIHI
jgi:uncharacterized protein YbgA (DUF1722 family)